MVLLLTGITGNLHAQAVQGLLMSSQVAQAAPDTSMPKMIEVLGGTFMMGNTFGSMEDGIDDALPVHQVRVSTFKISEFPVTWAQYAIFCKETGYPMPAFPTYFSGTKQLKRELGRGNGNKYPVFANYYQADAYCKWLSKKTGKNYRLPTEAEWEFAARGGNKSTQSEHASEYFRAGLGWKWDARDLDLTTNRYPNILGICNMSGGVWEWCQDWYSKTYYAQSPTDNPSGPEDRANDTNRDTNHVMRGGSVASSRAHCTVYYRENTQPGVVGEEIELNGFRIVLDENPPRTNNAQAQSAPVQAEQSLTGKLRELKSLYDEGLITKEEYDATRKKLLNQ